VYNFPTKCRRTIEQNNNTTELYNFPTKLQKNNRTKQQHNKSVQLPYKTAKEQDNNRIELYSFPTKLQKNNRTKQQHYKTTYT
jgi:hypothetical protein